MQKEGQVDVEMQSKCSSENKFHFRSSVCDNGSEQLIVNLVICLQCWS